MIALLGFILLIATGAGVYVLIRGMEQRATPMMVIGGAILFFTINTTVSIVQDKPNTPVAQVQKMVDNATADK